MYLSRFLLIVGSLVCLTGATTLATEKTERLKLVPDAAIDFFSDFPETEKIEKFLEKNPSKLFRDPAMGDLKKYFSKELSMLLLYKASMTETRTRMSRRVTFLFQLSHIVDEIIRGCEEETDKPDTMRNVETLISAFWVLRNHMDEIWVKPVEGKPILPDVIYLFRDILEGRKSTGSLKHYTEIRDWIATCENEEIVFKNAKLKRSMFAFLTAQKPVDVLAMTAFDEVFPNFLALEAIERESPKTSGSDVMHYSAVTSELKKKSEAYCTRTNGEMKRVTFQQSASSSQAPHRGEEHAFTVSGAQHFVEVMRRLSVTKLYEAGKRNELLFWLKNGAVKAAGVDVTFPL